MPEYVSKLDQIDSNGWAMIQANIDKLKSEHIDSEDKGINVDSLISVPLAERKNFKYRNVYLLSEREGTSNGSISGYNVLYVSFSLDVKEENGYEGTAYAAFAIKNVIVNPDGTLNFDKAVYDSTNRTEESIEHSQSTILYKTEKELEDIIINKASNVYTFEQMSAPFAYSGPNQVETEEQPEEELENEEFEEEEQEVEEPVEEDQPEEYEEEPKEDGEEEPEEEEEESEEE